MADVVVVVAVTGPEAKSAAHGISLFLVENGTKGFHKGRKLEKIGMKAQVGEPDPEVDSVVSLFNLSLLPKDTAELFFEDVRLPSEALLGEANKGFYYLMNELPQVTRLLCACKEEGTHATGLVGCCLGNFLMELMHFLLLGAVGDCCIGPGGLRIHV